MPTKLMPCLFACGLLSAAGLWEVGSVAYGDTPALKVEGIPERLFLPLEAGENRLLTATVSGGRIQQAWLAATRDSKLRVLMTRTGEQAFQINLADPNVAVLAAASSDRRFRIFAELASGDILESTPIAYAVRPRPPSSVPVPSCYLHLRSRPDAPRELIGSGSDWYDSTDVAVIEFRFSGRQHRPVRVTAGKHVWTIDSTPPDGAPDNGTHFVRLEVTPDILSAWQQEQTLHAQFRYDERQWRNFKTLKAIPRRFVFPGAVASLRVPQRATLELPGARGYYFISLQDITAGQVVLEMIEAPGTRHAGPVSLREGESVSLELPEETYTVRIRELVNVLLGEDWAMVDVSRIAAPQLDRIERLFRRLEDSKAVFIRDDREYTGTEAAAHLRQKLTVAGPRIATADEFIEKIASRSTATGKPYRVKQADGTMTDAGAWFRQQMEDGEESGQERDGDAESTSAE